MSKVGYGLARDASNKRSPNGIYWSPHCGRMRCCCTKEVLYNDIESLFYFVMVERSAVVPRRKGIMASKHVPDLMNRGERQQLAEAKTRCDDLQHDWRVISSNVLRIVHTMR
jgi:hypothetical protein